MTGKSENSPYTLEGLKVIKNSLEKKKILALKCAKNELKDTGQKSTPAYYSKSKL